MARRITIVIDEDNYEKLLKKQSREIVTLNKPYSFSRVVNDVVRAGFREESKEEDD